ncbi:hypothetical protein H0H81_004147 [Sphagnurus paluster]|uniref:BTB domain-containing protein n=1 Tax=Sphagnurus paluster TaxID=117069 RepID=A0A9P7FYJ1_9AGAR|nr:hypothetical protein H0H81_004147 [Sphagnurus paluster]
MGPPSIPPNPVPAYSRDEEFYLENIVFLVEDRLFSVPRNYFTHASDIFASAFSLPTSAGDPREGTCDETPLVLEGISRADFKGFLRVMLCPPHLPHPHPVGSTGTSNAPPTRADWLSALKLSTMWDFRTIRQRAISALNLGWEPVEGIVLGKAYRVPQWLIRGYHELVVRTQSITDDEAAAIGRETAARLLRIREEQRTDNAAEFQGLARGRGERDRDVMDCVRKEFREELDDARAADAVYRSLRCCE